MRRIKVTVAYDGTGFHGWQAQPGLPTIQQTLETVAGNLEGEPVGVVGSGRTDAGVHALGQVAAFSIRNPIPCENLQRAMNRYLPPSIRVLSAEEAGETFHPRFDAIAKTYEYRIFREEVLDPFRVRYVHHHPYRLNEKSMSEIAGQLAGEHDFGAFASADESDTPEKSMVRRIDSATVIREGDLLKFRVRGSGFLKHMVRNLTGYLVEVGKGNADGESLRALLKPGHGRKAAVSVPAKGLFLISVEYSDSL